MLSRIVSDRMKAKGRLGHNVTLKLKFADMQSITRSCAVKPTNAAADIYKAAEEMLEKEKLKRPIRLIGVTAGKLSENDYEQISLFKSESEKDEKNERLDNVVTDLRKTFGRDKLKTAKELGNSKVLNSVVLGAAARFIGFEKEVWLDVLRETVPQKTIEINERAFLAGYGEKI